MELGGFRRGTRSAALFQKAKLDVRMAVHGYDFACLSDEDGPNSNTLQKKRAPLDSKIVMRSVFCC